MVSPKSVIFVPMKSTFKKKFLAVCSFLFGILSLLAGLHTATFAGYDGDPNLPWEALAFGMFLVFCSYFVFTGKKPGALSLAIISALFTAIGVGMVLATTGDGRHSVGYLHTIGWVCIVFFGPFTLLQLYYFLRRVTHNTRQLEYDDTCFYLNGTLPIPWKGIKGFEQNTYLGSPNANVNVLVHNPWEYIAKEKNPLRRWFYRVNLRFGQPLFYNSVKYDGTQEEQIQELNAHLLRHQ